jgi:hypothetical protein
MGKGKEEKEKKDEKKSRCSTSLSDPFGCETLLPAKTTKIYLEPYGENTDPFEIKKNSRSK